MAFIKSNRLVKSVLLGVIVIAFLEIFVLILGIGQRQVIPLPMPSLMLPVTDIP